MIQIIAPFFNLQIERDFVCPKADNENLKLLPAWMTPAEVLQWVGREQEEMRRELAADFRLRHDRKHRRDWDNLEALKRCVEQHCFRQG